MGVFSWVGTSCSHPRVRRLWGGGCLSCCLSFPHPVQTSFTPIAPSLCCRSRAATATTAPLCICQPLSLPQFPPPSTPSSCSSRFAAGRGGSCQPHSPSTLLPSRPPKIPPLCPAGVWFPKELWWELAPTAVCVRRGCSAGCGGWPVNLDKPRQDPAGVAGGAEPHSVPLSGAPLF